MRLRTGWVNISRQMTFAFSMVWREQNPLIRLILLLNKHKTDHLQIQTHSEIPRFAICNEACPKQRRVACTKDSKNLNFSNDNSDCGEDHGNTVVKVLCYKSKGRWFDPDSSDRTMALGSTQPLT